ncbi:prevent-host-death protein [Pedobacter psychrodurus]|jgi:antitoxin (DNA-binding transcriptional repressor) of toxin-antitoxin stability system|uniref:type II toxin-antitoxin system Phd/YefM family antitoxin n=1 Tax=Pedobacter psychrodurus TaxID=2530456 RepID=UPI00292E07DF|nr:prevent-host-death protein [Pedobacter psychrodurus]
MKTMSVGEFKAHFSEVLEDVKAGIGIAVTYGRKKEVIGYFVPDLEENNERKIGMLDGKAEIIFKDDFKITEEEFLGL